MSLAKFSRTILLGYKRKIELWKLGVSIPELQTIDRFLSIAEVKVCSKIFFFFFCENYETLKLISQK